VLYQADEFGEDLSAGLKEGFGDKAASMIVAEASYEITDGPARGPRTRCGPVTRGATRAPTSRRRDPSISLLLTTATGKSCCAATS